MVASVQAFQIAGPAQRGIGGVDSDGDNDGSGSAGRARGGGARAFMQSVFQALSQLGLITPNQGTGSGASATQASTDTSAASAASTNSPPGGQQDVRHALHAFMHSLFHALRGIESAQGSASSGSAQSDVAATGSQPKYGTFTSALQTLLQGLGASGTASATNGNESDLQAAFQNLVQALGATGSSGSSTSPTLQSFLQALLQDLNSKSGGTNGASPNPAGNIVATAA